MITRIVKNNAAESGEKEPTEPDQATHSEFGRLHHRERRSGGPAASHAPPPPATVLLSHLPRYEVHWWDMSEGDCVRLKILDDQHWEGEFQKNQKMAEKEVERQSAANLGPPSFPWVVDQFRNVPNSKSVISPTSLILWGKPNALITQSQTLREAIWRRVHFDLTETQADSGRDAAGAQGVEADRVPIAQRSHAKRGGQKTSQKFHERGPSSTTQNCCVPSTREWFTTALCAATSCCSCCGRFSSRTNC